MDVLTAIKTRRSIRQFEQINVEDEKIEELLRLAMCAPSAGNQQTWHFIVVNDEKIKNEIADMHPHAKMLYDAPACIIVLGDTSLERYKGFWVQDCSAAIMNILTAAPALNLQTVWCGIYPNEERVKDFKRYFKLPENVIPLGLIVLGYSKKSGFPVDRFKPERIHYNSFKH
ncbi:nitroreductase family protein [Deferribacterales bacterium Es71-Z0220]|jgi:nitroreductase|uniref:nitroreductase family protein n=1 Tax=Deferrivibrio essentukiensis TaxID=2880922 RepID=UPI001F60BD34|nr:nitroreductase family protein [Deferrivibrio essentukiensis]MBZ4671848.1 nitroreductase [Deferribacteraceae bacterium]MCB4204741.1 nitroreductase family protein [Deferrivibrio essentukiensis]